MNSGNDLVMDNTELYIWMEVHVPPDWLFLRSSCDVLQSCVFPVGLLTVLCM
jgi:hypothetical protein